MMQRMVRCNIRDGLQAAIVTHCWVTAILVDGLVLRPVDEKHLARWREEYDTIFQQYILRWDEEDWQSQGYTLCREFRPLTKKRERKNFYKGVDIIPYPIGG